ncbi:hypothetical protein CALVIDRAFT_598084 [Calocera viscosa TUFC12733]|uniref:F-box domain-containing protein n=1 Tax=Calocera viscosa (strain TUFC12733) TaxID=1330018 RepID=A0A167MQK0_CALVF|nr:hypothetical protein CALVIDRAFT_598084 [Calocera viscosa TUFC12733]
MVHWIFTIHELLLNIFSHLPRRRDQKCFIVLSKAFWEVAVKELWKEVHDPWDLLCLLPRDVYLNRPGRMHGAEESQRLSRALNEEEWRRIEFHCKNIERLRLQDGMMGRDMRRATIPAATPLLILSTWPGSQPLFRSLQALTVLDIESSTTSSACCELLALGLRSVTLSLSIRFLSREVNASSSILDTLLEALAKHNAQLESMNLDWGRTRNATFSEAFTNRLSAFMDKPNGTATRLKRVFFAPMHTDARIVDKLGDLQGIEDVTLQFNRGDTFDIERLPETSFANLKRICLQTDWLDTLDTIFFLDKVSSGAMESIVVEASSSGEELGHFNALVASRWSTTLQQYDVICHALPGAVQQLSDPDADTWPVKWSDMTPVLECHQMQLLKIELQYPVDVTDDGIAALVGALPNLRVLHLGTLRVCHANVFKPKTTVRCLRTIAHTLTYLEDLMLDVDIGDTSVDEEEIEAAANSRIRWFESWVIGGPASKKIVQDRMRKLFPSLVDVFVYDMDDVAHTACGNADDYVLGHKEEPFWA